MKLAKKYIYKNPRFTQIIRKLDENDQIMCINWDSNVLCIIKAKQVHCTQKFFEN